MFAFLAKHLGASGITFNGYFARWTTLDHLIVGNSHRFSGIGMAGLAGMPRLAAGGTKDGRTGGTGGALRPFQFGDGKADDRFAFWHWTPSSHGVQVHLCILSKFQMQLQKIISDERLDFF